MKSTSMKVLLALGVISAALVACGDDSAEDGAGGSGSTTATTVTGSTTTTSSGGGEGGAGTTTTTTSSGGGEGGEGGGIPNVPELGPQLERMGRAAINTATIDTFLIFDETQPLGIAPSNDDARSASQDLYNASTVAQASDENDPAYAIPTMALQLTVLDALDGVCSNQAFSCPDPATGAPIECYGTLASVLAADVLWVKTDAATCGAYLGVEANFAAGAGVPGFEANDDCGGRRPVDDTIATTYTIVAGAAFDDLITAPQDVQDAAAAFPYLAAPHD